MIYNLSDDFDRLKFKERSEYLLGRGSLVELTDKSKRNYQQNNLLHLYLGYIAIEYGETLEWVKMNFFKKFCNPDIFIVKKTDPVIGETYEIRSSADVTKEEMSLAITRFRNFTSKELGIELPEIFTEEQRRYIETTLSKNSQYL